MAETLGELQVETENIWIVMCPDATALWRTSDTKINAFVNCWASAFSATGDIHKWVMWACMDGPNDAARLEALDETAGLNAQSIHLRESCTFCVKNETKKFQRKLTTDGKLMMVTNGGGGGMLVGFPHASGLVPIHGTVNKSQWGVFFEVCVFPFETMHTHLVG